MSKKAIITGAAGGIGAATVARLGRAGVEVHAVDRTSDIAHHPPEGAVAGYSCDVSDPGEIDGLCDQILASGPVDILVNGAGVMTVGNAEDGLLEDWERAFAINARAPWLLARRVIPGMKGIGGGVIVSISSAAGLSPNSERLSYSASKAALIHLTRSIALDYGRDGIRANTICPGAIDTPMYRSTKPNDKSLDQHEEEIIRLYPMHRLGTTDEVAATIDFMVSDAAAYMTGAAITVDGGRTLH